MLLSPGGPCLQAVTAGDDGALKVVPLEDSAAAQSIMEPRSSASYAAVRWSSPQAFVTAGTTGAAFLVIALPGAKRFVERQGKCMDASLASMTTV